MELKKHSRFLVIKMNITELLEELKKIAYPAKAEGMKKYMRNQFEFLGVYATERKIISKKIIKLKKEENIDWNFVKELWDNPYRELQYLALDYIDAKKKLLTAENLDNLKDLIITKSWWDTVDYIHKFVGIISLNYPLSKDIILQWSINNNIWLRRVAINHQIGFKEKSDTELLSKILINNFNEKEFFIAKAIGWALREYAKTNPNWVINFLNTYKTQMQKLSIREASKRLIKQI